MVTVAEIQKQAMHYVNRGVFEFNKGFRYVKSNIFWIVATFTVVYYFLPYNFMRKLKSFFNGLFASSGKTSSPNVATARNVPRPKSSNTKQDKAMEEEMMRVRLEQQDIASEKAKEAEKLRKQKAEEDRKRRNEAALHAKLKGGQRLGNGTETTSTTTTTTTTNSSNNNASGGGYNPMQPWSTGTGGYRPQRRNVRRGGGGG